MGGRSGGWRGNGSNGAQMFVRLLGLKSGEKTIQRPVRDIGRGMKVVVYRKQAWLAQPDPERSGGLVVDIRETPLPREARPPKPPKHLVDVDDGLIAGIVLALQPPDDGFVDRLLEAHNNDRFVDQLLAAHDVDDFLARLLRE